MAREISNKKTYKEESPNKNMIIPGNPSGLPDDLFKTIIFVDNAYLIRLKNYLFKDKLKYNLKILLINIAKENNLSIEKIFLYDAPPFQGSKPSETEKRKRELYDKFLNHFKKQGIIVKEGRTQRIKINQNFVYKQKGVDMQLGFDMGSVTNNFPKVKNIILFSGDSDFVPIFQELNNKNIKTILLTYFGGKRNNTFSKCNELIKASSKIILLKKEDFEKAKII